MTFNPNANPTVAVSMDAAAVGRSSTIPFLTVYQTRNPTANDVNYPIQQRWVNTTNPMAGTEFILQSYSNATGQLTAVWLPLGVAAVVTLTLTGNTNPGNAVPPDGANNIGVYGDGVTINSTGSIPLNRVTFSTSGIVATQYNEDVGMAIPAAGILRVIGGTGVNTAGAGNTITINANATVPLLFTEDVGTATPAANNLNILGANGLKTTGAGSTVTIGTISGRAVITAVVQQIITVSGNYTPTARMVYAFIQIVGGGGGGGGAASTGATTSAFGSSGASGEYAQGVFTAAAVGAGQVVTIGAAGAGGAAGANNGTAGGTTSVGALITAGGGGFGKGQAATTGHDAKNGGVGGTGGAGGALRFDGVSGGVGLTNPPASGLNYCWPGGSSPFGSGGSANAEGGGTGTNATGFGAGGSGAGDTSGSPPLAGGNGSAGVVVITEYLS